MTTDKRFEITGSSLALAFFRLKGGCQLTKKLLDKITERKKIFLIPATHREKIIIRFVICGMDPQDKDIEYAWKEIKTVADEMFDEIEKESKTEVMPEQLIIENDKVHEITENISKHFDIVAEKTKN